MNTKIISGNEFDSLRNTGIKVLMICPPVYDFRLEWPHWHYPTGLLQLGALLQQQKKDVRLIDCLHTKRGEQLLRHKIGTQEIQGHKFDKWHFGLPYTELKTRIEKLLEEDWKPDTIFVTSLNSIWWESVRDTIALLKKLLPKAKTILGGAYPTVEPEHAAHHSGADKIIVGSVPEVVRLSPNLSLYQESPYSTGIYFYTSPSIYKKSQVQHPCAVSKVLKEVKDKAELGVREFVFFDEEIRLEDREAFGELLDKVAAADLDVHFVLPGSISPHTITQDLARKMRRARVTQVCLRCDLHFDLDANRYTTNLSEYQRCVNALVKSGSFEPRKENLAAMLVVGLPYEDLDAVSERLIQLAHIVGSVILVPFQYVPNLHTGPLFDRALAQNGSFSPEKFNSKLYPLALFSGKKLEEYMELTRLATLLNSKYRSKTFDFLGEGFAAKMFRESIRSEGWNPFRKTPKSDENPETITLDPSLMAAGGLQDDHSR